MHYDVNFFIYPGFIKSIFTLCKYNLFGHTDTIANLEYTPFKFLIQLDLATSGLKEKHFQIP